VDGRRGVADADEASLLKVDDKERDMTAEVR
jgi:hypothetical protein